MRTLEQKQFNMQVGECYCPEEVPNKEMCNPYELRDDYDAFVTDAGEEIKMTRDRKERLALDKRLVKIRRREARRLKEKLIEAGYKGSNKNGYWE